MSIVPLSVDLYYLDLNVFLQPVASFLHLPSVVQIIGLMLFIFYLSISWLCQEKSLGPMAGAVSRSSWVLRRVTLLLPVLLPYVIITVIADILVQLPVKWIHSLFAGPNSSLYLFLVLIAFFLFFIPVLVKWLWRCKPLPASELRRVIEAGLKKQGVGFSDILLWPAGEAMACTAAVIGIVPGFRYILLTPCLIHNLSFQEIEAVIAHEAEHVRRWHLVWYMLFLAGYSLVLFRLTNPLTVLVMSTPSTLKYLMELDRLSQSVTALAAAALLGLLTFGFFRFVLGYFMRNFERQADMAVFRVQGHPFALVSALGKVAILSGMDIDAPNWHHYSVNERIGYLERAFRDRKLIEEHDRRLFFAKGIFVVISLFLATLPGFLPTQSWQRKAKVNAALFLYNRFIKQNRKDPEWLIEAGGIFFEHRMYVLAEKAYKTALNIDRGNPDIMNNLAWLYIKADQKSFFHPRQALLLAMSAAAKKPASYILDTLAECFFVNGYTARAIAAERQALQKARHRRDYYRKQLKRFMKALEKGKRATPKHS